jgi:sugar (pentulose or hexulose) kinase
VRKCYAALRDDVYEKYRVRLEKIGAIGISAMMHGYMAFDSSDRLLVPFRTWRNSTTAQASKKLTELFSFNIPQRWSIAHLYQAMLNGEPHVKNIAYITTLAGYIHRRLTGKNVLGAGDASGMFPIDGETKDYDESLVAKFDLLAAEGGFDWRLRDILPKVLCAGENAGTLTAEGAAFLDDSGALAAGIGLCPPEGDAGTGMAATNSIAAHTGNISAGTSVFAMIVTDSALKAVHPEIDIVATPDGKTTAMVHANNCTSDLNAWVGLFGEFAQSAGMKISADRLYETLYTKAMEGDADCGGLVTYGYLSGENITGVQEGRPLFARTPDSSFTLANFMRAHLYSAFGALKIGMDILTEEEGVSVDSIYAHGGIFKTKGVAQRILASAINVPVTVMKTAGEGGPWGMALLAAYSARKRENETLEEYLSGRVFRGSEGETAAPDDDISKGFGTFAERYKSALVLEKAAAQHVN